jgi:NAD(P)H-dependent FMN reductase
MKILAISGSLRAASHNTAVLVAASRLAPEGLTIELFEGNFRSLIPIWKQPKVCPKRFLRFVKP